jgi:hypothetical protein
MTSLGGARAAACATRILERSEETADHPSSGRPGSPFEEECREVFESVLEAMATTPPDPDRTAACCYLLRHLARGLPYLENGVFSTAIRSCADESRPKLSAISPSQGGGPEGTPPLAQRPCSAEASNGPDLLLESHAGTADR